MWTFQLRITGNGDNNWQTSARPYDKAEDAAAGVAHCQAVLAMNGVIIECRLVPHKPKHLDGDAATEKLLDAIAPEPEPTVVMGFARPLPRS